MKQEKRSIATVRIGWPTHNFPLYFAFKVTVWTWNCWE